MAEPEVRTPHDDEWVLVRRPNGPEGAVLYKDFRDPEQADYFKDARIVSFEDGRSWDGPETARGAVSSVERIAEKQAEAAPAPSAEREVRPTRREGAEGVSRG